VTRPSHVPAGDAVFCGRARELAALEHVWDAVAHGDTPGPRVVAIVAESGLGKTRVVQEFYRRLAVREQGETLRYWPAALGARDDNLTITVDPGLCDATAPVPFLWWGVRVPDPGARNQAVAGQFAAAVDLLSPHLAPLFRTRRVRDARRAVGLTIGKVVLDVAVDAVPFAGLFKAIGETALEVGQGVQGMWSARQEVSPGEVQRRQRDDLVERVVADLGLLLGRSEADGGPLPAVVVVDDVQFAGSDPSTVRFVARLLEAATTQQWPVLVIVTCWTAEWHRDAQGSDTVASAVSRHASATDAAWTPTYLEPVDDLGPMLRTALPGLSTPQAEAVLTRAGGNPRFLDEIIRCCARNPRFFEGRDLAAELTAAGLGSLLDKTLHLHDLVEERLQALAPDVRRALLLASQQGQEFVEPLVGDVVAHLGNDFDAARELAEAEHPHAFVRRERGLLGAFTQRVFHEVALRNLANEFDEDDVADALRGVLRRRLADVDGLDAMPETVGLRTCMLAARLLAEAPDDGDRHVAAHALSRLVAAYGRKDEHTLERHYAWLLADVLDTLDADVVHFYLYYQAADALRRHGFASRALALADTATSAQRRRVEAAPHVDASGALALLLKLGGQLCRDLGDIGQARARFGEALDIDRRALQAPTHPWADRDVMVSLLNVAQVTRQCGDVTTALALRREAMAVARARFDRGATRDTREDLAVCVSAVADSLRDVGDASAIAEAYAEALAHRRAIAAAVDDDAAREALATALERVGSVALDDGDAEAAAAVFAESVAVRRHLATAQDTPASHIALAEALRHVGDAARTLDDWTAAVQAYGESRDVSAAACQRQVTPHAHRVRSLALERLATTALAADSLDAALAILHERLALDTPYAEQVQSPAIWRDVAASHYWLSRVLQVRGDLDAAREQAALALLVFTDLHEHLGTTASAADVQHAQRQVEVVGAAGEPLAPEGAPASQEVVRRSCTTPRVAP
jgi:tetratricopeptide (TPR) repeat protein